MRECVFVYMLQDGRVRLVRLILRFNIILMQLRVYIYTYTCMYIYIYIKRHGNTQILERKGICVLVARYTCDVTWTHLAHTHVGKTKVKLKLPAVYFRSSEQFNRSSHPLFPPLPESFPVTTLVPLNKTPKNRGGKIGPSRKSSLPPRLLDFHLSNTGCT